MLKKQFPTFIYINLLVYGEKYWDVFLEQTALSRLASGNFPALTKQFKCKYQIFTTEKEIHYYKDHSIIYQLNQTIPVKFVSIQINKEKSKYLIAGRIQQEMANTAYNENAALFYDAPDHLYGPNVFEACTEYILQGKHLIATPNCSLSLEHLNSNSTFLHQIKNQSNFKKRAFNELAQSCLHPNRATKLFYDQKYSADLWSYRFWKMTNDCFVQKGFHLHPLYLWPQKNIIPSCITIDEGEFIFNVCPDIKKHVVATGSKFTYYELSDHTTKIKENKNENRVLQCNYWANMHVHPDQFNWFYKTKYYFLIRIPRIRKAHLSIWLFEFFLFLIRLVPKAFLKPFYWTLHQEKNKKKIPLKKFLKKITLWNYFESTLARYAAHFTNDELFSYIERNKKKLRKEILQKVLSDRLLLQKEEDYVSFMEKILDIYQDGIIVGKLINKFCNPEFKLKIDLILCEEILDKIPSKYVNYVFIHLIKQKKLELIVKLLKLDIAKKISPKLLYESLLILNPLPN